MAAPQWVGAVGWFAVANVPLPQHCHRHSPHSLSLWLVLKTCNILSMSRARGDWSKAEERADEVNLEIWIIQYCQFEETEILKEPCPIILFIKIFYWRHLSCVRKSIILEQNSHISPAWKLIQGGDGERRLDLVQCLICHSRELAASASQSRQMKNCCLEKEVTWIWMDDLKTHSRINFLWKDGWINFKMKIISAPHSFKQFMSK